MDLEDCIKAEFKKFGILGFMDVVEKRKASLNKKYRKILWRKFIEFYRLPKILLTIISILGLYFFLRIFENPYKVCMLLSVLLTFIAFVLLIKHNKEYKKVKERTQHKWLFEEMLRTGGGMAAVLVMLPNNVGILWSMHSSFFIAEDNVNMFLMSFSLLLVVFAILIYIAFYYFPKNAEKYLSETYPEYQLVEKV
ncbi:hypothetical protein [Balneicella halophila]|uniref:hypothetical protein n=1 Tax=Balneicella halophila TaxID=1537566 RepID=UPI000E305F3C|nr:hypothetical protein [Balneicella halophila]